ncbi:protein of unknown function (plasmid) [Cupriavidus taiwanensis]|uniref:Uncharacterized protein n=1 Tax=Cupriavidus taiwanensis TaxID=164546 RepID=A0A375IWT3_9BURK|nr:protein of unknown function [Cupriavidus taiwanensis]
MDRSTFPFCYLRIRASARFTATLLELGQLAQFIVSMPFIQIPDAFLLSSIAGCFCGIA